MWLLCSFQGPWRGDYAGRLSRVSARHLSTCPASSGGRRSLKTQQHAGSFAAIARRLPQAVGEDVRATAIQPGSVDMLGPVCSVTPGLRRPKRDRSGRGRADPESGPEPGHRLVLPRKEVIQPQLPLRLPCYDFTPVTSPTYDGSLPQGVRPPASGVAHSRGVTGGVYKARERIHRGNADPRLLATPPSWRRVSASNPNRDALYGIRSTSRYCNPLYAPM